ncbi:putative uncharacterized protein DDB_G0271606 [Cotesia glomerata]|uniref:Uncharacterized protein n=1 Tax=Cotesia glomerata TaxID=32391 RepID=A0AAV7IUS0_COTGL|nr:putative uncharacterized protein DDB_G0271606 [Cotesia glomerata]KAH0560492.1 hypothetical protein KQX54_005273 [Cotesia glomerata]
MEKEQLDSLQTVTVGSEKIPPPHSHYAPSEVYSSSESPPAYSRPVMKSTAVQIAKIIATTLITISVIIGSFILAAAWLQARASCTPEAINGMQAQINSQQQEFIKHLQPEALIQDPIDVKQNIDESSVKTKQPTAEPKEEETQTDNQDDSKADNESASDNENDDDYNDSGFSPVHIKFPLQLDLDDLANTLMQQSRGLVSCVVERRRSNGFVDGNNQVDNNNNNNNNNYQRPQRLSGERVVILCESGEPRRQEQQEQDLLTPIIVPLGNIQIPMQPHEQVYHRYQVQNQFSAPDVQTPPFFNARRINQLEQDISLPDIKNIAQMMGFGSPRMPPQMNHQQMELRPFPIEIRTLPIEVIRGMRPPMNQMQQHQPQPQQPPQPQHPMFAQEPTEPVYSQEQQTQGMMPPPPPPSAPNAPELNQREPRIIPQVHIIQQQLEQKPAQPQEAQDKPNFPFPGLPIDIIRFIQQVPRKIKSIIQHIDEEMKPEQEDRSRQEQVQEFKPFPMNARPIHFDGPIRTIEMRNLMEPENMEAHRQENVEGSQESTKLIADSENQEENKDDEDKKKIVVLPESSLIHQIEEGLFPRSHFSMPMRSMETFQIPMEVSARVMGNSGEQEYNKEQNQPMQAQVMPQSDEQEDASRPHYVQPRSIP